MLHSLYTNQNWQEVFMKKLGFFLAAAIVLANLGLTGCNTNVGSDDTIGGTFGKQADGSYKLDPSRFAVWYQASIQGGDTIAYAGEGATYTGAGVYYLFPATNFNINDYESLTVEYTTSGATLDATNNDSHLELSIKAITVNYEGITTGSKDYGISVNYPWLYGPGNKANQLGDGSFTIDQAVDSTTHESFEAFKGTGIVGIGFEVSPGSASATFNLRIRSMTLNPVVPPAPAGTYGKQQDGSYKLDPSMFAKWYNANLTGGNTIAFSGGGMYYLFPTSDSDFDINDYGSLVVEYTTSGATIPSGGHLEIAVKAITSSFDPISGGSGNSGTDLYYAWLPGADGDNAQLGDGSFTFDASSTPHNFDTFKGTGIVGFALGASGSIATFNLTINSMTLMPKSTEGPAQGAFGKQQDGSYTLDPSKFLPWYGATLTGGNTIAFSGGGLYYLFPVTDAEFDINDYGSLDVDYTTSGATLASGDHLEIAVKAITNSFTGIAGSGSDYGTDLKYQWLSRAGGANDQLGDGSFTINQTPDSFTSKTFDYFKGAGVVGFALAVSGSITTFNLTINSLTLMP